MSDHAVTAHDGLEIAVRDHGGDGPDVLFVHGAMRTLEDWAPVLGHLRGVRAICMDLRMHGRSGVPAEPRQDDFVRDIASVVEGCGLSTPFVVGHSYGGLLAFKYAEAHADCPGVVNIDGFDFRQRELYDEMDPDAAGRFVREFRYEMPADAGDDEWMEEQRGMLERMGTSLNVPDEVTAASLDRSFVRTPDGWQRKPSNTFFDAVYGDDADGDTLTPLRRIAGRVVYVVCRPPGDAGMFAGARAGLERHVAAIAADRPNVRLETIDATHFVIVEKPVEIAALISSFVKG